jgi:uncharacterized membrane protein
MLKSMQNEGQADRLLRILGGAILSLAGYLFLTGMLQTVTIILGVVFIITGATGVCLIYKILGINTCKK